MTLDPDKAAVRDVEDIHAARRGSDRSPELRATPLGAFPSSSTRAAACLREAERLYADFKRLTPYAYRPFARTFSSFAEYERWKRAQTNPWYR